MLMCKQCKKVVGAEEIQDGFCQKCYTPELVAEERDQLEKNKVDRPIWISFVTIPGIIINILALLGSIFILFSGKFSVYTMLGIGFLVILLAGYVALHRMKRWGSIYCNSLDII